MKFNQENFLLQSKTAEKLYEVIREIPIFDYHCHLSPQEIYEDRQFENAVSVWLGGDHYKWRLMRANGVSERLITGDAPAIEKFEAWAKTLAHAFGNPLYHWSHLELRQIFGIQEYVTEENWLSIYQEMNRVIEEQHLSPRKMMKLANVAFVGTTDHPLDTLEWHKKMAQDSTLEAVVAPTFRPDEAFVEHANFAHFVERLSEVTATEVTDFASFVGAMRQRVAYFAAHGCKASDHSFTAIVFEKAATDELNAIFTKAIHGETLTNSEIHAWQTMLFTELCRLYKEFGFVTQVHFGALRNNNKPYFLQLGADSGFDSMGDQVDLAKSLNQLLNHLEEQDALSKSIFYNLNPSYNEVVANTLANFQANEDGIKGRLQFGAAWWFADTEYGMRQQMNVLANQGLLANFVGMLTDSRSFLSYQRHDYFRRILSSMVAEWIDLGRMPDDESLVTEFMKNIAYQNAVKYFKA